MSESTAATSAPPLPQTQSQPLEVAAPQTIARQRRYAVYTESGWVEMARDGRVRVPYTALVGTTMGALIALFTIIFWVSWMDGLIVSIAEFGYAVGPMAVMVFLSSLGSILMYAAARQAGAHESRALITWGMLLNLFPVVLFVMALFGTLLAAMGLGDGYSPWGGTTIEDLGT